MVEIMLITEKHLLTFLILKDVLKWFQMKSLKKGNCLLSDLPHSYVMWLTIRDTLLYKISC